MKAILMKLLMILIHWYLFHYFHTVNSGNSRRPKHGVQTKKSRLKRAAQMKTEAFFWPNAAAGKGW